MATQNSQLIENLNLIYNEKLAQKTVLETTSDDFLMYHTYIAALKPVGYTSILQNGQVDVSSYKYAYVSVDGGGIVPAGSYTITTNGEYDVYNYATAVVEVDSSIPEGYVLPSGNIDLIQNGMVDVKEYAYATVAMPIPTGTVNITENGTGIDVSQYASANVAVPIPSGYVLPSGILEINENVIAADCSSYQYVTVDVEGGGSGSSADPLYDVKLIVEDMIMAGETTADYVSTNLDENFSVTMDSNEESIEAVEWDFYMDVPTGEIDQQTGSDIMERKAFHVIASSNDEYGAFWIATNIKTALEDYPDLYENIYPTLANATLTESEDPSEDGYDYLLEGDIYAWNLKDNTEDIEEITESGFYPNNGALGFDVNIEPTPEPAPLYENLIFANAEKEQGFQTGSHTIFTADKIYNTYDVVVYQESDPETDDFIEVSVLNYSGSSTPSILTANVTNVPLGGYVNKILTRVRDVKTNDGVDFALILNISGSEYEEININGNDNLVNFFNSEVIHFNRLDGNFIYFFMPDTVSIVNNKPIVYIYNWNNDVLVQDEDFTIKTLE